MNSVRYADNLSRANLTHLLRVPHSLHQALVTPGIEYHNLSSTIDHQHLRKPGLFQAGDMRPVIPEKITHGINLACI